MLTQQKSFIYDELNRLQLIPICQKNSNRPEFPISAFPPSISNFLTELCREHGLPPAFVAPLILGTAALACRGKYIVKRNNEHSEQVTLYLLTIAESGTRKSPLLRIIQQPIYDHEKQARAEIKENDKNASEPMYCVFKATPSALEKIVHEQNGVIGIVGSEAGFLKTLKQKNDDLLLMGYDGEPYRSLKVKNSSTIERPCLTISIVAQEEALSPFLNNKELQADGLIGRFLIAKPEITPKHTPPGEISQDVKKEWHKTITSLLDSRCGAIPFTLTLSTEAHNSWNSFYERNCELCDSKTDTVEKSFYRKLAGTTLRIAGILHLLAGKNHNEEISQQQLEKAIHLGRFFEKHTLTSLNSQETMLINLCNKAIKYLTQNFALEVPVRDIYRHLHIRRTEFEPVLQKLIAHNFIRLIKNGRTESCLLHHKISFLPKN